MTRGVKPGRMILDPANPRTADLVRNATLMAAQPWGWARADLRRSQRILIAAGHHNIAATLQPFIDEPALPLRIKP